MPILPDLGWRLGRSTLAGILGGVAFVAATACVVTAVEAERTAMISRIRQGVRAQAAAADNPPLERALTVMARIPRELFVPEAGRAAAYGDAPVPIGYDQTLSDAYVVALMTAAADPPDHGNVLDIGTGSGYQAAVLAALGAKVTSIEIVQPLAQSAKARLARLGFSNIEVRAGDGFAGAPDKAPYDAIIVAAGAAYVPQPLIDQLKVGGRIVMPIGASWASEQLLVMTKTATGSLGRCSLGWTMFVPLTGRGQRPNLAAGIRDRSVRLCFGAEVVAPTFKAVER